MFQNDLNTYFQTKLNLNTQSMQFKGDYLFSVDDGKFVIESLDGYKVVETNYTPFQVEDWRNTSQPYKRIDLQDIVAPITFAIRQTELDKGLQSIDEFITLLNGSNDTIGDYSVGFRIAKPSAPSSPVVHSGEHWVMVQVIAMLSAGKNLKYGNSLTFKMAKFGETLEEVVTSSIDVNLVPTTNPSTEAAITTISIGKVAQTIKIDVFFEDNVYVCDEFLAQLWQEQTANTKYSISLDYGFGTPKTGTYKITEMQHHIESGIPLGFTMLLYKSK